MSYRYIGNKARIVPILLEHVSQHVPEGGVVADLMCGTASVSEALRTKGFKVIASDIMTYSTHHARVRLLLDEAPSFNGLGCFSYDDVHDSLNSLPSEEGLFYREYSPEGSPNNGESPRQYFSAENASRIDSISSQISSWHDQGKISDLENSLLRHDLVLAANKVANIAGTYGHYRSKWSNGSARVLKLKPAEFVWGYPTDHVVMQGPVEHVSGKVSADLCYLDPPYMKRQYAANYHIIETIARGDDPEAVGVSGLRPWRDQYSDFCSKVKIRDAFRDVFKRIDCKQFLISYSEDALLPEEEMLSLFEEFGEVSLSKFPNNRFKSNTGGAGGVVDEYLFYVKT
jgi:adenine-specific DNA-methyltransferase